MHCFLGVPNARLRKPRYFCPPSARLHGCAAANNPAQLRDVLCQLPTSQPLCRLAVVLTAEEQEMYKKAHKASAELFAQYRALGNHTINKHLLQASAWGVGDVVAAVSRRRGIPC